MRQKFTDYERYGETGLDFAQARYYSSSQGRFASADPLMRSASVGSPQTFNRYGYALNNPLSLTDPSGEDVSCPPDKQCQKDDQGNEYYLEEGVVVYTGVLGGVAVKDVAPATLEQTMIDEGPGLFSTLLSGAGRGLLRAFGGALAIITVLETSTGTCDTDATPCGRAALAGRMADESQEPDVDKSATPNPEDNKPDTSENNHADIKPKKRSKPSGLPADAVKLKGNQGWRDGEGNVWKKDMLHKDHWDVSDRKGNKIKEVDFNGNQVWPGGPKNRNK